MYVTPRPMQGKLHRWFSSVPFASFKSELWNFKTSIMIAFYVNMQHYFVHMRLKGYVQCTSYFVMRKFTP